MIFIGHLNDLELNRVLIVAYANILFNKNPHEETTLKYYCYDTKDDAENKKMFEKALK